jgi:hydrogenase nickel incorporation protein HypA/HybF
MHEVGVAAEVIKMAVKTAADNGAEKVMKISITVGSLSGVEADTLAFALEAVKDGTPAEDAEIEIDKVKAKGICGECGKESTPDTFFSICEHCQSPALEITEGEGFFINYIEV